MIPIDQRESTSALVLVELVVEEVRPRVVRHDEVPLEHEPLARRSRHEVVARGRAFRGGVDPARDSSNTIDPPVCLW